MASVPIRTIHVFCERRNSICTDRCGSRIGNEILRAANIATNSLEVVQKNAAATPTATATVPPSEKDANPADAVKWDLVVLGRLNACYVCQRGSAHVNYTRILAGKIPSGGPKGTLTIAKVDAHIFSDGGVPIYESKEDEIVFLKKSKPDESNKDKDLYDVLDVKARNGRKPRSIPE